MFLCSWQLFPSAMELRSPPTGGGGGGGGGGGAVHEFPTVSATGTFGFARTLLLHKKRAPRFST